MRAMLALGVAAAAMLVGMTGAAAAPGPNGHNNAGLCEAFFSGSDTGRAEKALAPPFVALQADAASLNESVHDFCYGVVNTNT